MNSFKIPKVKIFLAFMKVGQFTVIKPVQSTIRISNILKTSYSRQVSVIKTIPVYKTDYN